MARTSKERMKKMNKLFFYAITLLLTTLTLALIPTEAEGKIYEDTVRLHILANSDTEEDQELKIKIRDDILGEFSERLSDFESAEEAKESIEDTIRDIESFCEERIRSYGYSYDVSVTLGKEWYETREYEDFTLPKGYYSSLKVVIGSGEGKNWWCVAYPPLCLDMALENAPSDDAVKKYSDSEFQLITRGGYTAKFKVLELVSSIFS